jgi:hypothetical protein
VNRLEVFRRLGLGGLAAPLAMAVPKLFTAGESAPATLLPASPGPSLVAETLEELLESGKTVTCEIPLWNEQITSIWQRIPQETLRRMGDGAVKSITWIYHYSDGSVTKWTEPIKLIAR